MGFRVRKLLRREPPPAALIRFRCAKLHRVCDAAGNSKDEVVNTKWVFPQNGWFIMANHMKMDDLGGNTPVFGNTQVIFFWLKRQWLFDVCLHVDILCRCFEDVMLSSYNSDGLCVCLFVFLKFCSHRTSLLTCGLVGAEGKARHLCYSNQQVNKTILRSRFVFGVPFFFVLMLIMVHNFFAEKIAP